MSDNNAFGNGTTAAGPDGVEATLGRLSKKAGVKATIVLDRSSGALLKTTGQMSSILTSQSSAPFATETTTDSQSAELLAALVWNFVKTAGAFVQDLDGEDELRLLQLRTKKQELVIYPDSKYLLVVVHDTPPA